MHESRIWRHYCFTKQHTRAGSMMYEIEVYEEGEKDVLAVLVI